MTEQKTQDVRSLTKDGNHKEEEPSPGAEMERSREGSQKSVADLTTESSSSSERPQRSAEEDELDGFPVFGAEEETDWDSSSSQKGRSSVGQEESERNRRVSQPKETNADDKAQQSHTEEGASQNEGNGSTQEPARSFREETLYSPLMKIKDEPIDEGYDKALIPPSDISRVKEELENGDQESAPPPDELRISSVFSVRGTADAISGSVAVSQHPTFSSISQSTSGIKAPLMVLPAQTQLQAKPLAQIQLQLPPQLQSQLQSQLQPQIQSQLQLQPQLQPQPQPPPTSIRICCSGCCKVLQKGQTAFQRKGSNQLFCSTVCLTGFNLPPTISIAPKKTCHLCLKVIGNPKDLITVPVDSSNTLKEFCSQACLTIFKSRIEGFIDSDVVRCTMCRNPSEIQHEVNHQGVLHRLCSDECFSRFRSSKRLSMSCCENCGTCTVTGNYHLVQVGDAVKKFCSPVCISSFKQKSGKRVHCPCCQEFKSLDQMLEGTNAQGVIEFFCSSRCVTNSQASRTLSGASFPCTNCQKLAIPQYHLAMHDGSIRNFCSYECVNRFQERLQKPVPQVNGSSAAAPNTAPNMAARGPQHSNVTSRPAAPPLNPDPSPSYVTTSGQNPAAFVSTSNQNPIPPYVPAHRPANPQDDQQQPNTSASGQSAVRLTCKQCQKQFRSKPVVLQFKNHVGLFCSRLCCDTYKRENDVKAVCEYCKEEKVLKNVTLYEQKPRTFCCEGCKLLFKHDLAKQHGSQCRTCAYCCNMTHSTIHNHFGGKLEEFCTEECMSLFTVLFYEMAKCHGCKTQGTLTESLKWDGRIKHFCNLRCVLQFCSRSVVPDQPSSNGITTAAQAPLSVSKDMPVIGGVVSLASALAGNTALTGALPTSNASSKIIGDASTQTEASVNVSPQQRRMLKNKALMCKPIVEEQGIQCELEPPKLQFETVVDENGEKMKLVPLPVPIPMPVYIPVPMHLYSQFTPVPFTLPLPVPVPMVVTASLESLQQSVTKASVPSQSSVEDEDVEKSKDRPVSRGDQGSTYSGDLESEARSTPFSWADPEDTSQHLKPLIPSPASQRATDAPPASASPSPLDLEKDFPISPKDHESTKEQRSPAKRRKRAKRAISGKQPSEEPESEPDCAPSFSDDDQLDMDSCWLEENRPETNLSNDERVELQVTSKSDPPPGSSAETRLSPRLKLKKCKEVVCKKKFRNKRQFCVYCRKPNTKIARHLQRKHAKETDVAHALSFPKGSKKRHLLLDNLCKKGNYQHNIEVLRNGRGEIVPKIRTKGIKSIMEYLPCQYCLAFYLRRALMKHERSCKMIHLQSSSLSLPQGDSMSHPQSSSEAQTTTDMVSGLSPVHMPSPKSSDGPQPKPDLESSLKPSFDEYVSQHNLDSSFMSSTQSNPDLLQPTRLEPCSEIGQTSTLADPQPSVQSVSSDLDQPPSPESCRTSSLTSKTSYPANDRSSPEKCFFPSPESVLRISSEPNPQLENSHLGSSVTADLEPKLPLTPDSCPQPTSCSIPGLDHPSVFESSPQFMESCNSEADSYPDFCPETTLRNSPEPNKQNSEAYLESCLPASPAFSPEFSPLFPASSPSSQRSLDSWLQEVVQDSTETDVLTTPKSCHPSDVEFSPQTTLESSLDCSMTSNPHASPKSSEFCHKPGQSHKDHQHTRLKYNLRSKLSPVPKVSPYIERSGNSEPERESDVSSGSEYDPVEEEESSCSLESADEMRQSNEGVDDKLSALSSSQITASQSEARSSTETRTVTESPSSPASFQKATCSNSSDSVQQITVNTYKKPANGRRSWTKKQVCFFCKKSCNKLARHLRHKHKNEPEVAHALSFSKGSQRRLLLFEQIRSKGNFLHNISVLQNGNGELITKKRPTVNYSVSEYLPCQHCLSFFIRHDLWRHEKTCKLKNADDNGCRKRIQSASSNLLPLQGVLPGACEEILNGMNEGDVLDHIKEDSLICKYGDRLFVKHGHDKKHQAYIAQKLRELGRFMLAVKELDQSIQQLHQICTPSRFELALNGAKKISGFDESSNKLRVPSLVLKIGYSVRQTAEVFLGESIMAGDTQAAGSIKEFIDLIETNWISSIKNCEVEIPERLDGFLDTQGAVNTESVLKPEAGSVSQNCPEVDRSLLPSPESSSKPPQLFISESLLSPSSTTEGENVDNAERELSANKSECNRAPTENATSDAEAPLASPAAARPAARRKSKKNVKVNSKFSSFTCKKASSRPKVSASKSKASSLKSRGAKSAVRRRIYRKLFCAYCKRPVTKIARHLARKHAKEKDVAHALSFPKGSKTRRLLLQQLRNKGNYQHNINVLQNGNGEIVPLKRTRKNFSLNDYQSCPDCLGFVLKCDSWRHQQTCKMKKQDKSSPRRRRSRSDSSKTLSVHDCLSEGCQDIVRRMRDDDISKNLRNDVLICKFGNRLYEKHGHLKSQHSYISQKMRELGRFMAAVKDLDQSVKYLDQVFTEARFSMALEAAKKIGSFEQASDTFKTPVIATKIGYSLKQAAEIALRENIIGDEAAAQAKRFIELLETEWFSYISSHSCISRSPVEPIQKDVTSLMADVIKFQSFLRHVEDQAGKELMEDPCPNAWKKLRNALLATVTVFNRSQKAAFDEMLLTNYAKKTKEPLSGYKCENLSKLERSLNGQLTRIESAYRDGSIPVLLTERMETSMDILTKYRERVDVPEDNPYVFARMGASTHVRATDCLRDCARSCGANKPESLTSVYGHKFVATAFQILSLNESEMQSVATAVGEGNLNYQEVNENPMHLEKICYLLHETEQRSASHRENSPDADSVKRKRTSSTRKNTKKGPGAPKDKRKKWGTEEQEAVKRQMATFLSSMIVPGKNDCLKCLRTEPDALRSRTWRDVKNYVHNTIQSRKRRKRGKETEDESDGEDRDEEAVTMDAATDGPCPKRRPLRRSRRRLGSDAANGTSPGPKIHHVYGVKAWSSWVQWRAQQTDASPLSVKEDVLQCSPAELSEGLCRFIDEVRRPNGQTYAPDSIYYLCLGIQQYLLENGRLENIFMDPLYSRFTANITRLLKDRTDPLPPSGVLQSRVEESFLWECRQLGALSPLVLLNTLLYFGVKLLKLKTLDQHERLSFSSITRCTRTTKQGTSSYLRVRLTGADDDGEKQAPVVPGKRKREDEEENEECTEMPENCEDPLRCPVRLYEFYLSKCPDSVRQSPDRFYMQPVDSCNPESPTWFSSQPLERTALESMLTRVLTVRDIHLDAKQLSDSSDEDSS